MSGSRINPYKFAENIDNIENLKKDINNNPWFHNLINNEITKRDGSDNINKRKTYYYRNIINKYENYIYILNILYFVLVFILIVKIVIYGQGIIKKQLLVLLAIIIIFPFTIDYINNILEYFKKEAYNYKPVTLHSTIKDD